MRIMEELVCADMSEADKDKSKHCNLASMPYDFGVLYFLVVGLYIEISTELLYYPIYMKLYRQRMVVEDFVKESDNGS